jgi:hypothetical protein
MCIESVDASASLLFEQKRMARGSSLVLIRIVIIRIVIIIVGRGNIARSVFLDRLRGISPTASAWL